MDLGLRGKVAIVTGAANHPPDYPHPGQGESTARLLVQEGAKVVLADIKAERGAALAEALCAQGHEAIFVPTDVTQPSDRTRLVDRALDAFGAIDILVNAAGCHSLDGKGTGNSFPNILEEDWDLMYNVHVKGSVFLTQEVARRAMIPQKSGRIVMVSSLAAHGKFISTAYGTAKAAISWFTLGCAVALGKYGIRVNCVSPGLVLTPIYRDVELKDSPITPQFEAMMKADRMLGLDRFGAGTDIAKAILFLVSDLADYVTSVDLNVSAGQVYY
ncbi:MAG: SDR family oxidoreductase [Anaerolineae bacterium]|nr:SDR family oxidoreductase [Anaerolineae bacterium]